MDRAGMEYWQDVWQSKELIAKIDLSYYTYRLLDELFKNYFPIDNTKSVCEIGCAMSPYLLYFHDRFGYTIHGFDYDCKAVEKTKRIYRSMGYEANIFCQDLFAPYEGESFDLLTSFGVFEHFEDLSSSLEHTKKFLKPGAFILTLIPNMRGVVGWLQKCFNPRVYNIHVPYTSHDLRMSHESVGYETLFCDYYGTYQGGVINIDNHSQKVLLQKLFALPGKPLYRLQKILGKRFDSKMISPYVIYIGKLRQR